LHFPAAQLGFAWLERHVGLGAVLLVATLASVAAQLLVWLTGPRAVRARAVGLVLVLAAIELGADDLCARGQVFADVGFAVLLLLLDRLASGRSVPWFAPVVLSAFWTNFHPSFVLAITLPLAIGAATRLDPPAERAPLGAFLRFSGLAVLGAGLTPYSFLLPIDVMKMAADPSTMKIDLFRSPDFRSPEWLALVGGTGLLIAARSLLGPVTRRRSETLFLVVLLGATCSARRFAGPLMALEVMVVVRLASDLAVPAVILRRRTPLLLVAAALQLLVAVRLAAEPKEPLAQVPADAVAFVNASGLPDRVWAPYHWGGYLDYVWLGRRRVFIDGRVSLFSSNGVFDDASTIEQLGPGWWSLLDAYEIATAITERGSPLDQALSSTPGWKRVFQGRLAAVHVRSSLQSRAASSATSD
jgi:hypothetical protein